MVRRGPDPVRAACVGRGRDRGGAAARKGEHELPATVVVGLQFGDEGKGKITDYLAHDAELVVRSQGGANAGHTVVIAGDRFALHQVPSGIFRGALCVIGNGVVLDANALVEELEALRARGVDVSRLRISDRAHLVLPYHMLADGAREDRGAGSDAARRIGTTRKGIGPAYADKSARIGVRVCDLLRPDVVRRRVADVAREHEAALREAGIETPNPSAVADAILAAGDHLRAYVTDTSLLINEALDAGRKVLFEGAQGAFLDVDLGTYPYVTSSHPVAGGVTVGAGVGPTRIDEVIGVMKAYTSRVGEGPFPGEILGRDAEMIRERGQEYGTTTGRPRRVGWTDLVSLRYACRVNAPSGIVVNALDVLGGMDRVPVVEAYRVRGVRVTEIPASVEDLADAEPEFREMAGWPELGTLRRAADMPDALRAYLKTLADAARTPVVAISVGRDRDDVIWL